MVPDFKCVFMNKREREREREPEREDGSPNS